MPASINDKLKKYKSLFSTTLSTGIGTGTSDTITPATVTGLPTDTAITLTIDRVDASGTATPSKMERIKGVVSSGNIINYVRAVDGTTEQAHTAGAVVEMVWNADDWNNAVDHLLVEHGQDGKHTKVNGNTVTAGTDTVALLTASQTLTNKTLTSPAFQGTVDGWISANETWTYASATTITVPSGAAAKYAKGDKIRLKQGAGYKYFYIIGVADTVLTVTGGSDFTVANDTITDNYYSHESSPIGFPNYFKYTPTGVSSSGVTLFGRFGLVGNRCHTYINISFTGGITFTTMPTLPIKTTAELRTRLGVLPAGSGMYLDSGTAAIYGTVLPTLTADSQIVTVKFLPNGTDMSATVPITWANGDGLEFTFDYEI